MSAATRADMLHRIRALEAERDSDKTEIVRLINNAEKDGKLLLAYHQLCTERGFAPSSSELVAAGDRALASTHNGPAQ